MDPLPSCSWNPLSRHDLDIGHPVLAGKGLRMEGEIICLEAEAKDNMNNVLVLVFASEFFGPLEPTLAAMYMIPFFGLIFPMRVYQRLKGTGQIND